MNPVLLKEKDVYKETCILVFKEVALKKKQQKENVS